MRLNTKEAFSNNSFVTLQTEDWLEKQRVAGKIAAQALTQLETYVKNSVNLCTDFLPYSMLTLSEIIKKFIISEGGTCTFENYKGFPAPFCVSINQELVHGIPKDYVLSDGDIVSFDLGVTYQGAIADTAITCIYGQPKSPQHTLLVKATEEALMRAIASIKIGKRLGCIGNAIAKCAKEYGLGVVTRYGGHGISMTDEGCGIPHASPFVANKAELNEGIRIQPGLVIAIEPLFCVGSPETTTLSDGWTVVTKDISCHVEHSLYIHEDRVEIITWRENSNQPKEIFFNKE